MKKILVVLMIFTLGLFVGCSKQRGEEVANGAGTPGNPNNSATTVPAGTAEANTANLSDSDKDFMNKAALGGQEEVELGNLAQLNGSSDAVKSFGQRMITDHQAAGDKLKQLAQQKNVTLEDTLTGDARKDRDTLTKKKGADFDKAYMALMVKDHQDDVNEFQKEADKGQDQDVKAFASSTLPTLQDHLNQAKNTKSGKNNGSKSQTQ